MTQEEIKITHIDLEEAVRYMGYRTAGPDELMMDRIRSCEEELLPVIHPRYCYRVFDLDFSGEDVTLAGASLRLKGLAIRKHLEGCQKAVILCTTLSDEVDRMLRKNELTNMVKALAMEALSNAAVEQVCDAAEEIIMKEFTGYHKTWRFGVGYDDFPLETQKQLLATLDAGKRIGVCATESSILTPRKSVTCVIGLSSVRQDRHRSCENCRLKNTCDFRKNAKSCRKNQEE